jgi:DNA-binding Lrp family transcriptional regulator
MAARPTSQENRPFPGKERTLMAIKSYVLIVTDPGKTKHVFEQIQHLQGIQEVHEVMGPYDIVAEIEVSQLTEVPEVIIRRIRAIEGIQSTTSLVAFPV